MLEVVSTEGIFIDVENGVTTFIVLPKSLTLIKSMEMSGRPYSASHWEGVTYVGLTDGKGIAKLDSNYQLQPFLTFGSWVYSVSV